MPRAAALRWIAAAAAVFLAPACALAEEVVVGLAAPLSGRLASDGLAMERALRDAITEANASGGVDGRLLTLAVEDDGCATATGEGAARVLAARKAAVVIGHPCSSAATAAVPIYVASGVMLVAVGARHPAVTDAVPAAPVLRMGGRDDRQGLAAALWLLAASPSRRVAIVHDRTRYAREICDATVAALGASGIVPVALIPIVAGHRAYDEVVEKIVSERVEAVLFAGYPQEAAIIAGELAEKDPAVALLGSDAMASMDFARIAERLPRPATVLLPAEPAALDHRDRDPPAQAVRVRGAFEAWLVTARKLGTTDGATLTAALRGGAVETRVLGALRFEANGDLATAGYAVAVARGGRWTFADR